MPKQLIVAGLVVALLSTTPGAAQNANWQSVRPGASTQADAIHLFGTPDYVEIEMDWAEFLRSQAGPRAATTYSLKYLPSPSRPEVAMLNGPLGRASSSFIFVKAGKVEYVEWDYCCIYREPARRKWLDDKSFGVGRVGKLLMGQKAVRNGLLSASCGSETGVVCDGDISVLFMAAP